MLKYLEQVREYIASFGLFNFSMGPFTRQAIEQMESCPCSTCVRNRCYIKSSIKIVSNTFIYCCPCKALCIEKKKLYISSCAICQCWDGENLYDCNQWRCLVWNRFYFVLSLGHSQQKQCSVVSSTKNWQSFGTYCQHLFLHVVARSVCG